MQICVVDTTGFGLIFTIQMLTEKKKEEKRIGWRKEDTRRECWIGVCRNIKCWHSTCQPRQQQQQQQKHHSISSTQTDRQRKRIFLLESSRTQKRIRRYADRSTSEFSCVLLHQKAYRRRRTHFKPSLHPADTCVEGNFIFQTLICTSDLHVTSQHGSNEVIMDNIFHLKMMLLPHMSIRVKMSSFNAKNIEVCRSAFVCSSVCL